MPFPQRLINLFDNAGTYSGDGVIATSYADDYIVRGSSFTSELVLTLADGAHNFLFDASASTKNVFTLPVSYAVDAGPVTVSFNYGHGFSGGTPLKTFNRNANSSTTNEAVLSQNPTGSGVGTVNSMLLIGTAGQGGFPGGGSGGQSSPFIVNNAVPFLIIVDNQTGGEIQLGYTFTWYEI